MTWLVWRQHRSQLYFAIGALAAFAALLLVTGLQMASQYHAARAACAASDSCGNLANSLFLGSHAIGFLIIMTVGVPALLGLFWGAPLVARELETGTSQFAWMQSVTRRRWLAVKRAGCWSPQRPGAAPSRASSPGGPARITPCSWMRSNPAGSIPRASSRWAMRCSRWLWASQRAPSCAGPCRAGRHPGRLPRRAYADRRARPPALHDRDHRRL